MKVLRPGLLTTVQDLGRHGFMKDGISVGGAMDDMALRLANRLVGNPESAAGLELTLTGPVLEFERESLIAVCGAHFLPTISGQQVPPRRPVRVRAGTVLTFGTCISGCRSYLAVAGGVAVPMVLGSRGTHLRARFGGFNGRPLIAGDVLATGAPSDAGRQLMAALSASTDWSPAAWSLSPSVFAVSRPDPVVRTIRGHQFGQLSPSSQQAFFTHPFVVTPQSDRMGYRLQGTPLALGLATEMISEPVNVGTVQLPPGGQPILLMADCQTTGGYPRIAHVITVDRPIAAQLRPGDTLRFAGVSLEEAQRLLVEREREWAGFVAGIQQQMSAH